METTNRTTRQILGCGFEPPAEAPFVASPWTHESTGSRSPDGGLVGFDDDGITTCAGYTVHLPEVFEAMRARHWAGKGQLEAFCDGEQPSEALLKAIEILDGAHGAREHWSMTDADKGGGRQ